MLPTVSIVVAFIIFIRRRPSRQSSRDAFLKVPPLPRFFLPRPRPLLRSSLALCVCSRRLRTPRQAHRFLPSCRRRRRLNQIIPRRLKPLSRSLSTWPSLLPFAVLAPWRFWYRRRRRNPRKCSNPNPNSSRSKTRRMTKNHSSLASLFFFPSFSPPASFSSWERLLRRRRRLRRHPPCRRHPLGCNPFRLSSLELSLPSACESL
mmetsp:Transcript_198/g.663  ORF Transcript_198/g.663 Transcript_198/m.663 type:complete len:205 (-) Transcript_198:3158-3772(-)